MTKRLPRFDSHIEAFQFAEGRKAADLEAANDRAANLPFFFALSSSDTWATIYDSAHDMARPMGTIRLPRRFGAGSEKLWTVSATDGAKVYESALRPSAMQATRALIRHYAAIEKAADLGAAPAEEEGQGEEEARAAAAIDPAPCEVYGPGEETPADLKARRAAFVAAFALAPIAPAYVFPLAPSRAALAQLAALNAGAF